LRSTTKSFSPAVHRILGGLLEQQRLANSLGPRDIFVEDKPKPLIGDQAYGSDPLDAQLKAEGIEIISPHRKGRKKPKTQEGCKLRRYKRRWKVERLFAWLGNYRRLVVRYERQAENYLGFVQLGWSC
jgi:hypothetical protein